MNDKQSLSEENALFNTAHLPSFKFDYLILRNTREEERAQQYAWSIQIFDFITSTQLNFNRRK